MCAEESEKEERGTLCVSLHPVSALQWGKGQEAAHYKIKFYKRTFLKERLNVKHFFLRKRKNGERRSSESKINLRRSMLYGDSVGSTFIRFCYLR